MFSILWRYRELFAVLFLITMPLLLFIAGTREPGERNPVDRAVLTVFAPVQKAIFIVADKVQDIWFSYIYLSRVSGENLELRKENLRLKGKSERSEEILLENERLRRLLQFQSRMDQETVAAYIIAVDSMPAFARTVRIGSGVEKGIGSGDTVLTPQGVVGRVVATGKGWSDIMLIADPNSSVPAVVSRSRTRVTVRGTGDLLYGVLDHAYRTDDILEGDLLVTAGTGGIFPKGLPIGRISELQKKSHGLFQEARVGFSVDLSRLEEVLLIIDDDEDSSHGVRRSFSRDTEVR